MWLINFCFWILGLLLVKFVEKIIIEGWLVNIFKVIFLVGFFKIIFGLIKLWLVKMKGWLKLFIFWICLLVFEKILVNFLGFCKLKVVWLMEVNFLSGKIFLLSGINFWVFICNLCVLMGIVGFLVKLK